MGKIKICNVCQEIKSLIDEAEFLKQTRKTDKAFTRKRKMPFRDMMHFIMGATSKILQTELDEYFEKRGRIPVSRQAFSVQRENLKPEAFIILNNHLIDKFEKEDSEIEKFKGYRVFSVDGSIIDLPKNQKLGETFGFSTGGTDLKFPKAMAMCAYDSLNKLSIFSKLYPYVMGEREGMSEISDNFCDLPYDKMIWLLDRGYPSFNIFYQLLTNKQNFVIRIPRSFFIEINEANKEDQTVTIQRKGKTVKLRVVNIKINDNTEERIITNLDNNFTVNDINFLYQKRWGSETNFNFLKNRLELEVFTGESVTAVYQDFYAAILMMNMARIAQREQEGKLSKVKNTYKNKHYSNMSKLIYDIKINLLLAFGSDNSLKKFINKIMFLGRIKKYAYSVKDEERHFSRKGYSNSLRHRIYHSKSTL